MKTSKFLKAIIVGALAFTVIFMSSCQLLDSLKKPDKSDEDKTEDKVAELRTEFDDITIAYFGENKSETVNLTRKIKKNGTEVSFEVTSSNKNIIAVSEDDGELTVTAKGVGNATITVEVFSDEKPAFTTDFKVTSKKYTKIACVGDSLTFGHTWTEEAYPVYLSELFSEIDSDIEVKNFGVNGASVTGIKPQNSTLTKYTDSRAYSDSIAYKPDVVVILLGTNDVNGWQLGANEVFVEKYFELVDSYIAANAECKIISVTPPTVLEGNALNKHKGLIDEEIAPAVLNNAIGNCCVDFHSFVEEFDGEKFRDDGVHLSATLAEELAKLILDEILKI